MAGTRGRKRRRAGNVKKRDIPPDFDIKRETPRSLSQTLRVIRLKGADHTQCEMAKRLGIDEALLRRWERPPYLEAEISLRNLQKYQDLLGIPNSIIHAISQILAAARDDRPEMLEVLAIMLGKLAQRIATPDARGAAIDRVLGTGKNRRRPADTLYSHWNNLLDQLIGDAYWASELDRAINSGPAKGQPLRNAFVYRKRLEVTRKSKKRHSQGTGASGAGRERPTAA